ncbi:MAG: peptidoglycan-binding protein [Candidatus Pacebacteria bacterium]|nr:peptidoglycan-binding protein [Candidatus Paceibacterota bacterium]
MLKKLMIAAGIALLFGGTFSYAKAEDRELFKVDIRTNDAAKKEEIKKLQGFLINQKLLTISEPNGSFGPLTKAAVKKLQKDLDLPQVGAVGPATRAKINTAIEDKTSDEANDKIIVKVNDKAAIIVPNNKIPRVMFWWGKVNQHIDLATGTWQTDSNGLEPYAGASVDKLEYCKRIYPNSIAIKAYMFETIPTWHDRGNVNNYTSTNLSYRCILQGETVTEVSAGDVLGVSISSPSLKADTAKLQKPLNFYFSKYLSAGIKHPDVSRLQKVLIENGYLAESSETGVMDEATVLALKDFQEDNKVEMTGTLGPKTRALIGAASRRLGACAGNQQKVIVKNPNGGEVYQAGQRITVKWRTCRIPANQNVRVDLVVAPFPPTGTNGVGLGNTPNDGREQFTLPAASAFNGNPMSFGQNFKVLIWYPNGSSVSPQDVSDNLFTINGTTIPAPIYTTDTATSISSNSATLNATIYGLMDVNNGTNQTAYFQYGTSQSNLNMTSATSGPVQGTLSKTITGLAPSTTYYYRAAINFGPNSVPPNAVQYANIQSFTTSPATTTGCTGSTSSLTLLRPNGMQSYVPGSVVYLDWLGCNQGLDGNYQFALVDSNNFNIYLGLITPFNATSATWTVPANVISGQYTVRVFCTQPNSDAYCVPGSSEDFSDGPITITAPSIAPTATTSYAIPIGNSYQLGGRYTSNSLATNAWFMYGTSSNPGSSTLSVNVPVTNISEGQHIATLSGLMNNTTYYYKLCVQNMYGQACGSVNSFVTATNAPNAPTLTVDAQYANQSVSLPSTNYKIGSWTLKGSTTPAENVLLTSLSFDVDEVAVSANDFNENDITNMFAIIRKNGTIVVQTSPLATVVAADNNFSINYTLLSNNIMTVELYANLGTSVTNGEKFKTDLTVTGTSLMFGTAANAVPADTNGQTITASSSSISAALDASTPSSGMVYDNQTVDTAKFNMIATGAAYNVTDITLTIPTSATYVAQSVMLYDGATLLATRPASPTVIFSGLNWLMSANSNKVLTVKMQLGTIGGGAAPTQANLTTTLTSFIATNMSTGVSTAGTESNPSGNAIYAYAALPSITQQQLPNNTLANMANAPVLKFRIDANGGLISWKQLSFDVLKSSNVIVGTSSTAGVTLWDATSGTQVSGTFSNQLTYNTGTVGVITFIPTAEQQVSGSKVYELRANINGVSSNGNYVTVTLPNDSAAIVMADTANVIIASDVDAPIVWSDNSAISHSVTTSDWTSDYMVRNLPISDTLTF